MRTKQARSPAPSVELRLDADFRLHRARSFVRFSAIQLTEKCKDRMLQNAVFYLFLIKQHFEYVVIFSMLFLLHS